MMKIIIACESSERIKKAFLDRGIEAHSCDLKTGEQGLPNHHQCDIRQLLKEYRGYFDILIGHPDCTYLANSGVRWLIERPDRMRLVKPAANFFNELLYADIPRICIENPIQHKYARQYIRHYDQIIQPYHFGDAESKATCLWLVGLPPLMARFSGGEGIKQSIFKEPPSLSRKANRSRTFKGIAEAMAEQWGGAIQ